MLYIYDIVWLYLFNMAYVTYTYLHNSTRTYYIVLYSDIFSNVNGKLKKTLNELESRR